MILLANLFHSDKFGSSINLSKLESCDGSRGMKQSDTWDIISDAVLCNIALCWVCALKWSEAVDWTAFAWSDEVMEQRQTSEGDTSWPAHLWFQKIFQKTPVCLESLKEVHVQCMFKRYRCVLHLKKTALCVLHLKKVYALYQKSSFRLAGIDNDT